MRLFQSFILCVLLVYPLIVNSATYVVTRTDDPANDANCFPGNCSFRQAMNAANSTIGVADTITFGIDGVFQLTTAFAPPSGSDPILVTDDLTVRGNGMFVTTIDGGANLPDPLGSGGRRGSIFRVQAGVILEVQDLTVRNGDSRIGGAPLSIIGGTATLNRVRFSTNFGGIGVGSSGTLVMRSSIVEFSTCPLGSSIGIVTILNSTFQFNHCIGVGDIIKVDSSTLTIINSTFTGNDTSSAPSLGGGVIGSITTADVTIINSTFHQNVVTGGAAIDATLATVTVFDSIITGQIGGADCSFIRPESLSVNSTSIDSDSTCDMATTVSDPLLGVYGPNTGLTPNFALLPSSPAVDIVPAADCSVAVDQRGVSRPRGFGCDAGAFEYEPVLEFIHTTRASARFDWDIEKTVAPSALRLAEGTSAVANYTVAATKSGPFFLGEGSLTIRNPLAGELAAIESATVAVDGIGNVDVVCTVAFPTNLPPGGQISCVYQVALPNVLTRSSVATINTSSAVDRNPASAVIDFFPLTIMFDSITVVDDSATPLDLSDDRLFPFSFIGSASYERTITCDDEGIMENVARAEDDLTSAILDSASAIVDVQCFIPVDIDIKPGSSSNPLNPRSRGVIPVAILTTPAFDVSQIDRATVAFGPSGAGPTHASGHLEDVDRDGDTDLLLHFSTPATGISCGDTSVLLRGQTLMGRELEGANAIRTVGCR